VIWPRHGRPLPNYSARLASARAQRVEAGHQARQPNLIRFKAKKKTAWAVRRPGSGPLHNVGELGRAVDDLDVADCPADREAEHPVEGGPDRKRQGRRDPGPEPAGEVRGGGLGRSERPECPPPEEDESGFPTHVGSSLSRADPSPNVFGDVSETDVAGLYDAEEEKRKG